MKQKCKVYGWSGIEKSPFYKLASVETKIKDNRKCKVQNPIKAWGLKWDKTICSGAFDLNFCPVIIFQKFASMYIKL